MPSMPVFSCPKVHHTSPSTASLQKIRIRRSELFEHGHGTILVLHLAVVVTTCFFGLFRAQRVGSSCGAKHLLRVSSCPPHFKTKRFHSPSSSFYSYCSCYRHSKRIADCPSPGTMSTGFPVAQREGPRIAPLVFASLVPQSPQFAADFIHAHSLIQLRSRCHELSRFREMRIYDRLQLRKSRESHLKHPSTRRLRFSW